MASWRFYCKDLPPVNDKHRNPISRFLQNAADVWENRRLAKIIREQGIPEEESERLGKLNAEADMTDRENIHFKYQY
jgi:hypothetical protein